MWIRMDLILFLSRSFFLPVVSCIFNGYMCVCMYLGISVRILGCCSAYAQCCFLPFLSLFLSLVFFPTVFDCSFCLVYPIDSDSIKNQQNNNILVSTYYSVWSVYCLPLCFGLSALALIDMEFVVTRDCFSCFPFSIWKVCI